MLYLLDIEGAANPEPIAQDNFETIERELLNFPWGIKTALETRTSGFATPDAQVKVPVKAGKTYMVRYHWVFDAPGVNDMPVYAFGLPAITGNAQRADYHYRAGAKELNFMYEDAALLVANVPVASSGKLTVFGWLRLTPSADGDVSLNWGNGNGSGLSKLLPGSWITAGKTEF